MSVKSLVVCGLSLLVASPAVAQNAPQPGGGQTAPASSRTRAQIEIHPRSQLLYRRCTDWYELQNRPSGTVLFPGKHCWWVRG